MTEYAYDDDLTDAAAISLDGDFADLEVTDDVLPADGIPEAELDEPRDEESIEDYFASLMTRIRGEQHESEPAKSLESEPLPQPVVEKAPAQSPQPEVPKAELPPLTTPNELSCRHEAPERAEQLRAMREVANRSCGDAIGTAQAKCRRSLGMIVLLAVATWLLTVGLLALSQGRVCAFYWGALVSLACTFCLSVHVLVRTSTEQSRVTMVR